MKPTEIQVIPKHDLEVIIEEREAWAKYAYENDLHGSAAEWLLTVKLAKLVMQWQERER